MRPRKKPLSVEDVKELIHAKPGITITAIEKHFKCNSSKVHWAFRRLRDSVFLFKQVNMGTAHYYTAEYAAANNIPASIKAPKRSNAYYREQAKARSEKHEAKKANMGELELHLLLTKLWPANRGLAAT